MRKRALAGLSEHHLEQKRLRRKEEGNAIYDPDSMERDETNVEKNGCNAFLNGNTETHAEVNSTGRIAEASAIRLFSSQKDYSSSDAVPNKEDDTLAGSLSSYSEQSMLFTVSSAFLVTDKDCQASNLSQSDQASLYEVDQAFTSYDTSSEANHAAKVNNHLSSDILPVEKDRLPENSDIEFEGSSIHEKLENYNDLKSTNLKPHNTSLNGGENNMLDFTEYSSGRKDCQDPSLHDNSEGALGSSSPIDVIGGYSDSNKMIIEPDFRYDNLNSGTSELAGGILEIKNNIISETVLQSYSIEGPFIKAIVANEDIIDRNYPSCSTEVEGQPVIDSIPLLTECRNDDVPEKAFQKSIQAKASEKMNCTVHENLHERSFSSAISIEINKKIPYANFKMESSLPPSPITGVIDCLVGKPNGENTHLDSFNEEETSFSFQMLNKSFSKEIPRNEISFEMQGALEGVVESCHGSQNLTEKVVAIDIHGDMTTQQKERKASVPFNSTSKDDSLSKDKSKVVQEIGAMRPERSVNCCTRKTLLVLDLNGILCDIVNDYHNSYRVEKKVGGKPIFKRPFCDDFLKFCFDHFYIGIWSSRRKYNVDSALDYLMGDFKDKLLFCWDQSKCTYTGARTLENHHKPLVLKELRKLWNKEDPDLPWEKGDFSPSNTLLLDDSPYKALCNPPHTAIFPFPYQYTDERDNSLGPGGDIRVYLEQLVSSDDVQNFVEEHPFGQSAITASDQHWYFYCQIIKSNSSQL